MVTFGVLLQGYVVFQLLPWMCIVMETVGRLFPDAAQIYSHYQKIMMHEIENDSKNNTKLYQHIR